MQTIANLIGRGGPVMWPLLFCSLLSLTVSLERLLFWMRQKKEPKTAAQLFELTENGRFTEAADVAAHSRDATARILLAGLQNREHGFSEGMEVAADEEIARQRRGLGVLDTIITLSPLLGIFGTVIGIIASFDILGQRGITDPRGVTSGIAQALVTTAAGLAIALVTLIFFNAFRARVESSARRFSQIGTQFEVAYKRGKEHES
ncbi:MAG: MotA/TolQ/ExbB proton channel family protein [Spirochaetia bacterium]